MVGKDSQLRLALAGGAAVLAPCPLSLLTGEFYREIFGIITQPAPETRNYNASPMLA